jgi:hypothetical protein
MEEVRRLHQQEQSSQKNPKPEVSDDGPDSILKEDPFEVALASIDRVETLVPLDRGARRNRGFLALHFDDKAPMVRDSFRIERVLEPTRVSTPLQQAFLWSTTDAAETVELWAEAVQRARWLDQHHPGSQWSEAKTREVIRNQALGNTVLERMWQDRLGD